MVELERLTVSGYDGMIIERNVSTYALTSCFFLIGQVIEQNVSTDKHANRMSTIFNKTNKTYLSFFLHFYFSFQKFWYIISAMLLKVK